MCVCVCVCVRACVCVRVVGGGRDLKRSLRKSLEASRGYFSAD